jgi:hypothetical protein
MVEEEIGISRTKLRKTWGVGVGRGLVEQYLIM